MLSISEHGEEGIAEVETGSQSSNNSFAHRYASFVEKFAVSICFSILLVTFGLGGITLWRHGFPSFPDPNLGFEPRGTMLSTKRISYHKFTSAGTETLSPVPHRVPLSQDNVTMRTKETTGTQSVQKMKTCSTRNYQITGQKETILRECSYPRFNFPKIVYESSNDESLFQMKHLKAICDIESKLMRTHPTFLSQCLKSNDSSTECCSSWSLGYTVALMNNKSSCFLIDEADVEKTKNVLAMCATYYLSGELNLYEPNQDADIPIECTTGSLVYTVFHYLLPKSFVTGLQKKQSHDPAFTLSYSPMYMSYTDKEYKENTKAIYQDNFQNSKNINDSLVKIVGLDFALKAYLFNDISMSDMLLVAMGVVSVIIIIWVYTGSLVITVGSVANMLMSFVLSYFFYYIVFRMKFFPFLNLTSVVLIIGIGADDTFIYVDLWKAVREKIGRSENNRALVLEEATRHAFLTLLVTSLTTSAALFVTAITNIIAAKCFAIFAGSAIIANLIYTVTWLPGVIIIYDRYFSKNQYCYPSCFQQKGLRAYGKFAKRTYDNLLKAHKAFFQTYLPRMTYFLRFVWVIVFSLIGVASFIVVLDYPGLSLQENGEFRLYRDSQPFERYDQHYKGDLAFVKDSRSNFEMAFIWGVMPTVEQNLWDPSDCGILNLDNDFAFGDIQTQMWLSDFCQTIKKQAFYGGKKSRKNDFCFIDSFSNWMNRSCVNSEDDSCCEQGKFPFPKYLFDRCVVQFMAFYCETYSCYSHTPGVRFDQNNSIRAMYLNFQSSVPYSVQFQPVDNFWKNVSSWTQKQISKAPPGLQGGWVYSDQRAQLTFYDLQASIVSGTVLTICISLSTAAIVLFLVTQNILITIYAMITITFIVSSVVGTLVLLGWQLNIFEAIAFSLAVGLSVDFTIHYGVAYTIAPFTDRKDRTFFAIETLSSSITVAAISTFAAGAVMIPAVVIGYSQIGTFLTLVMSLSWLFSTFFFSSMCMAIGPNSSCCQISFKRFLKMKSCRRDSYL
ncbi:Protein dispatched-like 1 [Holothuria leucospilota]|uniref:Protein dispatched-like 1 n=1 Tax=Holothuria leucospilota TaxID=206669 RepID=A0A9Q1HF85_HOLLE|nr:Protein dispatched-like 1 [Holothuria leucospilota]